MDSITKEDILKKIRTFYDEKGYFPSKKEIDEDPDLPSSMTLYRKFGPLTQMRKILKMEAKPLQREKNVVAIKNEIKAITKWAEDNLKGADVVRDVLLKNNKRLHMMLVPRGKGKNVPILVHFFSTKSRNALGNSVRFATNKFKDFPESRIYLVCIRGADQEEIQEYVENKKKWMPDNMSVVSIGFFKKDILDIVGE